MINPPLTGAERLHLWELFADAWDRGRVGEPRCDELYAEARELVAVAWERRRPELDALLELECHVRQLRVAQADPWGPDDQQVEWERDRVREALAGLDRIREEADR